jgi:hypothetical protein
MMDKIAEASDFLRAMRQRIEQGWIQGGYAKTKDGWVCRPESELACAWCLSGAMLNVGTQHPGLLDAITYLRQAILSSAFASPSASYGGEIIYFNDKKGRTKEEVLAKIEEAIELALADGM